MADLSVRWQAPRFRGEVALFRNGMDGYIQLAPSDEYRPSGGGDSLQVYRYEQTDAVLWGGELRAEYEVVPGFTLRGRCETVRGDDTRAEAPLPLVPPLRAVAGAEVRWAAHGRMQDASLGTDVEMVGEQTRTGRFETPTASYALWHLEGGIEWTWYGRAVAVDLQLRNVLDTSYREHLSRYKEFALDPGRNLLMRVSTGF